MTSKYFRSAKNLIALYIDKLEKSRLSHFLDVRFVIRFAFFMTLIYGFNTLYVSVTDDRGMVYFPYFDQHLNYFSLLRSSILHMSDLIVHSFGYHSYIPDPTRLRMLGGHSVIVGVPCLGYGMMSFWISFVLAHFADWKRMLAWAAGGVVFLWLLNSTRVALLLIAVTNRWNVNKWMDNHTLFNNIVYLIIIGMICIYYKANKKKSSSSNGAYRTRNVLNDTLLQAS